MRVLVIPLSFRTNLHTSPTPHYRYWCTAGAGPPGVPHRALLVRTET